MLKVDKRIKDMPWPEEYSHDGNQNFKVTLSWPVIDHERFMVATFIKNRANHIRDTGSDFRLICSKKQNRVLVLYKRGGSKREYLQIPMYGFGTHPTYCYPEISSTDEKALMKWLGERETRKPLHAAAERLDISGGAGRDRCGKESTRRDHGRRSLQLSGRTPGRSGTLCPECHAPGRSCAALQKGEHTRPLLCLRSESQRKIRAAFPSE